MWTDKKSIVLSRSCVVFFMALLVVTAVFAPAIVDFLNKSTRFDGSRTYFLLTVYTGSVPAVILLLSLYRLLGRIAADDVFIPKNVESLRHISWCCFLGALLSAVSALYYFPWIFIAAAAGFVGLIVRVVKNVFSRAVALQDDADHTI